MADQETKWKFYALALLAMKQPVQRPASGAPEMDMDLGLQAWGINAYSESEAVEAGMRKALEVWPITEGWGLHRVSSVEVTFQHHYQATLPADDPERVM